MDSTVLYKNLTIFRILNLILTHQDYRAAYIYVSTFTDDASFKIPELTWYHMVPVYLIDLERKYEHIRSNRAEPILNVFVFNNSSEIYKLIKVKEILQPNDVTVILFNSPYSNADYARFQPWMKLSIKVLIFWKPFLISVNQCKVDRIDKITVYPYNEMETKKFVEHYLADSKTAQGAMMTVFLRQFPPKSAVGPLLHSNNYTFNGPDGVLSDVLFKFLNVTTTYVTDIGILYPYFKQWKNSTAIAERLHYYGYHKEATTTNVISRFNVTSNSAMDFYMSPQLLDEHNINHINPNTESLYPHDINCLIVVVPVERHVYNFLETVIENGDIRSIFFALLMFAVARIAVRRSHWSEWLSVTFRTLQFFLNQGIIMNQNYFEAAWTNILRGFSIIAISTMSAILYQSLIHPSQCQIDTVADLIQSNLPVLVPESISYQFNDSSTNFELRSSLVVVKDEKFSWALLQGELNSAFVLHESNAQFLMKMKNLFETGSIQSRIMKEKLYCKLHSYQINKLSPFKRITNDMVLRFFENGVYNKVHQWAIRLNEALYATHQESAKLRGEVIIDIEVFANVFSWYLAGMFTSSFVFFLEICVHRLKHTTLITFSFF